MQATELTPRTKEILLKFFDYLEVSASRQRGGASRFVREQRISAEEIREVARTGKALILS
jgi:hypothetical protein